MKIIFSLLLCIIISLSQPSAGVENDDRIVGGQPTYITVHPYQISMRIRSIKRPERDFNHSCGGSIYDKWTIITAAHCVIEAIASQIKVVAGSNYRQGVSGIIVNVAELIFHDEYNPDTYENDVAFLILQQPLPLNNFTMKAIELSDKEYSAGTLATLSGWGRLNSGGVSPFELRSVQIPIVDRETCRFDYRGRDNITQGMICAGLRGIGGKDTCQGDSGGPLVIDNKLAGIVSWGLGCALPDYPGVYANVKYYIPWFEKQISEAKLRHNIV